MTHLLLLEDNEADAELFQLCLDPDLGSCSVHVVRGGEEALAYLRGGPQTGPRPQLTIMDLNVPRMDGRTLLTEIKNDPALATIPVVVFTSSEADIDIRQCYLLGASAYVLKPTGFAEYKLAVHALQGFWASAVRYAS